MKPTKQQIVRAVKRLGALAMFPASDDAQEEIMRVLERLVGTQEQLDWLVLAMIDRVGKWEGTRQLREVFCSQFQAADGVQLTSEPENFAPARIEEPDYYRQYKSLPAPEIEPITEQERQEIEALNRKIKLQAAKQKYRPLPKQKAYKPPEWLT